MIGYVRTALGDIEPSALGPTDYHEHLFQVSPLLPGEELDDEAASGREAQLLRDAGITGMVDATPLGLGRNPAAAARISAAADLHVVMATGVHHGGHYPDQHDLRRYTSQQLAELFTDELLHGMRQDETDPGEVALSPAGRPVMAGLIKAGIGYWSISDFEQRVLEGVGAAHVDTGAPVMVHLEHGSAAIEVLDLLERLGVQADRVVLAHIDRNPDPGLHIDLAQRGAYLGYDGMARTREWPESILLQCLESVAEAGAADRLLLGGDVARRSRYIGYGGMPGMAYLPTRFIPRVARLGHPNLVHTLLVHNPASFFCWKQKTR